MSEPVAIAQIEPVAGQGMVTLRGDLSDAVFQAAAKAAAGVAMPGQGQACVNGAHGLCWMSPDEVLVLCPHDEVPEVLAGLHDALAGVHAMAVDVSDARAVFAISGAHARDVLAKLAPVDLRPGAFTTGMFRRTRMAQVPAAFWCVGDDLFHVICFRSVAQYVHDLLTTAAQPGSAVEVF